MGGFTPDGKRAYVINNGNGAVLVITTATGAVSAPITVGKRPGRGGDMPDDERQRIAVS